MASGTIDKNQVTAQVTSKQVTASIKTNIITASARTRGPAGVSPAETNAVDSVNGKLGTVVLNPDDLSDAATTNKFTTAADKAKLAAITGTNTGDQDLSALVTKTTTVNGYALSSNVTLAKADVGLSLVDNTSDVNKPVSAATTTALAGLQPLDADLTTIASLTPTTTNMIQSVAGAWASQTSAQVKTALALNNVSNTSDASKPVSTAQATANTADRDRANHTNTQLAATISDFSTAADARITAANKKTDSMTTGRLLGRGTAGTGVIEEITLGTNLSLTGTTLNATGGGGSSPTTTKGDLAGYDTASARVPIGTNGQVLTADSVSGLGLKWATPASGVTDHTLLSNIGTNTHAQIDTALTRLANTSGTNTGDNSANTLYSGLVSNATHTGDATGATALTVSRINGTSLAGLSTGILKNTTGTGVPSIAIAADFPTLNQNTTGSASSATSATTATTANGINSATTTVSTNGATAPTAGQALIATSSTAATWQTLAGGGNALTTNPLSQFAATTSLQLAGVLSDETGTGAVVFGTTPTIATPVINGISTGTGVSTTSTASTLVQWDANKNLSSNNTFEAFNTTATAGATTTLTVASTQLQAFTGTLAQSVSLPTTSAPAGAQFTIVNQSTGLVTVQSSALNAIVILAAGTSAIFTALVATPTTAANWNAQYLGDIVASGKKLIANNSLTLAGTDGTTMTFPTTSATLARTDAANTFIGVQTMTSPSLTTPTIGVATATSVNKVTITAPATSATLTLAQGSSLVTAGAFSNTLTTTAATNVTLPTTGTLATLAGAETLTTKTLAAPIIDQFGTASGLGAAWSTWTPTPGSSTGALTTASATGSYKQIGKTVYFRAIITITAVGTAAGSITFNLPINSVVATDNTYIGSGREGSISGKALSVCLQSASMGKLFYYDNTFTGANGAILYCNGFYESV